MTYFLPKIKKIFLLKNFIHGIWKSPKKRYSLATVVDLCFIILILILGADPASKILPPLVSPFISLHQQLSHSKPTEEVFSFAPGLAPNKFSRIDFNGLSTLSYFDVPVNADGSLNKDHRSYLAFKSEESSQLFETAHYNGTKVLLTLTMVFPSEINDVLSSEEAQNTLAEEAISEIQESGIDGVTINFDLRKVRTLNAKEKFNKLVNNLTSKIHNSVPNSNVAVAIPSSQERLAVYDLEELSKTADKILVIASSFAVPESKDGELQSPIYGYKEDDYWSDVNVALSPLEEVVSKDKLALERAWYGDGNRYPLYVPSGTTHEEESSHPSDVTLDSETIERLVANLPRRLQGVGRKNIPLIGQALQNESILDSNVLAYALATVEHETASTFQPIEEYYGEINDRRLGYEGGSNYFGRGFIQLTHLRNYKIMGERIGMGESLVRHPELASTPEVSAKILAAFFKDNNIANLASQGYFVAARTPVNPDANGWEVAELAQKFTAY